MAAAAGAADGIAALPEELLFDVLSRVGNVKCLFLFAVTSRRWLRLFTDPAFLRGLCPARHGHRARLLGFFSQPMQFVQREKMMETRMLQSTSVSATAPAFLPTPGSPLGRAERALTAFVSDDDGTFNYAVPLAARRGIVLMHLVPRSFGLERTRHTADALLALCNPTTGERHLLPPPIISSGLYMVHGYAIVTAADGGEQRPSGRFTFSQLLIIASKHETMTKHLQSYSAATRSWSAPTVCLDDARFSMAAERSAVVHHGAAHWLYNDEVVRARSAPPDDHYLYKLSVELGTARRVSMTKLPVRAGGSPLLCVSRDGKLSVACVYLVHVTVWTQQEKDDDGGDDDDDAPVVWHRTKVIRIPMAAPRSNYPNEPWQWPRTEEWFEFNRGSMLVMYRGGGVFVLDLEEQVMEKVMDCSSRLFRDKRISMYYVPYEMDLVEFFVSHLGGVCKG